MPDLLLTPRPSSICSRFQVRRNRYEDLDFEKKTGSTVVLRELNFPEHFPNMLAASNGKFLNPRRAAQIYEQIDDVKSKFYDYEIWELPAGATADMFSRELSGQLARSSDLFGVRRFRATLTRERLYQFASRVALPSELREGYQASIFLRFSGWPAGARRRGNDERKLRGPLRIVQCAQRSLRTALGTELAADLRRRMETS